MLVSLRPLAPSETLGTDGSFLTEGRSEHRDRWIGEVIRRKVNHSGSALGGGVDVDPV